MTNIVFVTIQYSYDVLTNIQIKYPYPFDNTRVMVGGCNVVGIFSMDIGQYLVWVFIWMIMTKHHEYLLVHSYESCIVLIKMSGFDISMDILIYGLDDSILLLVGVIMEGYCGCVFETNTV